MAPRLYLIDGSGFIFRAFFAIKQPLTTSAGMPTNALMGFTRMLRALLNTEDPDYVVVTFDTPAPTFRKKMYPQYKANRPPAPPNLIPQFPYFERIVEAMNIPVLAMGGWEADDIIGTLCKRAREEWDLEPVIVSGDKDMLQLVDEHTTMYDPMKERWYGPAEVEERFGVPPELVTEVLGLAGDSSDNIPGVPGIGEKTAAKMLGEHGNLEQLLAAAPTIKGKRGEALVSHADMARLSKELATISQDVPVALEREDARRQEPNVEALRSLYEELEFRRFLRELEGPKGPAVETNYRLVQDEDSLSEVLGRAKGATLLAVDTETTSTDPMRARLLGVSLAWAPGQAAYIPFGHQVDEPQLPMDVVIDALRPLLADAALPKVAQNAKYDWKVLRRHGVDLCGIAADPMLASYLLNPGRRSHGLDALVDEFLGHRMIPFSEAMETALGDDFSYVPLEPACRYAAEDADFTLRLAQTLEGPLHTNGFSSLLEDMELPVSGTLGRMELVGIRVDADHLGTLGAEFRAGLQTLEDEILALAGHPFNIGSTQQLGQVLFDELDLPVIKKTKTGRSTNMAVLEQLAPLHPLPNKVVQWRHLSKLLSTYVESLPAAIHPETGRVHTSFKQAVTATGRISSDSPNLQNIPIRTPEGRRIREAFTASPGHVLLCADYSQMELRVFAHLAGDQAMVQAFAGGEDIHNQTASEIFNVFPMMVSPEQRRAAKAINFGIIYGMSAFRLSNELKISRPKAQQHIDAYFARYPAVAAYIERCLEGARKVGYTSTLFGRRRYFPDINSANHAARSRAEREATNATVQGTAADILKLAMVAVDDDLQAGNLAGRLLLTVHDELVLEVPEDSVEQGAKRLKMLMEDVVTLDVPLAVDVHWANNWAEAK